MAGISRRIAGDGGWWCLRRGFWRRPGDPPRTRFFQTKNDWKQRASRSRQESPSSGQEPPSSCHETKEPHGISPLPCAPEGQMFFRPSALYGESGGLSWEGVHAPQRFPSASQGIDLKQRENMRASTVEGVRLGCSRSPRVQRHVFLITFRPHPC